MTTDAVRMAKKRAADRDLVIPGVADQKRRDACESDDCEWLRIYCPDVFYNPFSAHQKRLIADCGEALKFGTQKCKAAPRGDGKTSIVKYLALKYVLSRQVNFPLILAATSSKAKKTLASLKRRMAKRADSALLQDYPLECHVAQYVEPWPSRARNVLANGQRPIHVIWGADWFVVPTWEDEESLGPIVMSLGITSDDLQGCNVLDQRPDFVMLDDLDSRDSLAAENGVMADKIEQAIDKTVAGLGGQSKRLGKFFLCTITSRSAAAYKYSDPKQKPSWSGERIPAILKWPENSHLWDTYIELRQSGKRDLTDAGKPKDSFGREAHEFYEANREAMDLGAELANPHNFNADSLPDGSPCQLSALQRCYDYIADEGLESFQTEHQQDPPEVSELTESGITAKRIQLRLSGLARTVLPEDTFAVVQGIDVRKAGLHWVVRAFREDATPFTIDYGFHETHGTKYGSDEGVELAIFNAILERMEVAGEASYGDAPDLSLIDSNWMTPTVYAACSEIGMGIYPARGHGKSNGCAEPRFTPHSKRDHDTRPGDGWYMKRQPKESHRVWLVHCDTDRWKSWEHARWLTPEGKPGAAYIFDEMTPEEERFIQNRMPREAKEHHSYARHLTAEVEVEDVIRGVLKRYWKTKAGRQANHYLDASYLTDVAAAIKGVRLIGTTTSSPIVQPRPTLSELAEQAKGA